ncbi:fructose 1,6-bisphosphatase [Methanorbis rubei]|uniref:Fructose-1,6-bisphosphate aldolase/phosphatase n=1 Tax=Methanorbis rubei TaxID=3028300 RepID=A0AAE4SD36_9EURY|nr:Fructose-1,6-bisphosphate aldolase/phosphatase [Methanocorpusculaceae archaeon Cs1]
MATTISVCALPLGGVAGSVTVFPDVLQKASKVLKEAEGTVLTDSLVTHIADWLVLVMVHQEGGASPVIAALKDAAVKAATETSEKRRLLIRDDMPVLTGLSFTERESEAFVLFLAGAATPQFWNPVLLAQFANPFTTASLADKTGFVFCTEDASMFQTPQDLHRLITAAKTSAIIGVAADADTPAAAAAGVVMLARAETPYPSTSELCGVFARPKVSPDGVLMPVSLCDGGNVASGIVPVVALGFSVANGKLSGPVDLFDNPAFAAARIFAGKISCR